MLKLNRTTEYGLIAISYIRSKGPGSLASAREIADQFRLPFEILAKTLQRLKEHGVITSTYGTRGGYELARDLNSLSLTEFLHMMEGPVSVVGCAHPKEGKSEEQCCEYSDQCNIRENLSSLNGKLYEFLNRSSVEELTRTVPTPIISSRTSTETSGLAAKTTTSSDGHYLADEGGEP